VPNWIDTQGYAQGFLFLRWQELPAALPPNDDPISQVVALTAVRSALPTGTPTVTPAQRKTQLAERDNAEARRLRTSSNQAAGVLTGYLRQISTDVGRGPLLAIFAGSTLGSSL
jgi:hypothetical protein